MVLTKQMNTGNRIWKFVGCFVMAALWTSVLVAQMSPERYVVDHWTTEDGLPVNSINEVIQSRDGYIWMATFDGLVRFDGIRFKIFDIGEYPELSSNRILRITELNDGSLWMLSEQRFLVRYHKGKMKRMDLLPEYHGKGAGKFFTDHRGWLWLGSDEGLNLYRNGKLEAYKPGIIQGMIDKIYVERSGAIWYRDRSTLNVYRYQNNKTKLMARARDIPDYNAMLQASDGSFFLSTGEAVYHFAGDSLIKEYSQFKNGMAGIAFYQLPNNDVYMATIREGVYRFRNQAVEKTGIPKLSQGLHQQSFYRDEKGNLWKFSRYHVYKNDQLVFETSAYIRNFAVDKEGSIWLATDANGLYRLKPSIFNVYSTEQGLPGQNIYPILETDDGSLWLGTHNEGLARLNQGSIETGFTFNDRESLRSIRSLGELSDGTILAGLYNSGVHRLVNGEKNFVPIDAPKALQETAIYSVFEDSRQWLWIGCRAGLFLRKGETWQHFTDEDVLPHDYVRYITEAPDGNVWFATNGGGIIRFHEGNFTSFGTGNGLSSNLVREIHIGPGEDEDSYTLWIGTEGRGLNRIRVEDGRLLEDNITYYDESAGLFDNGIHRILDDGTGYFWMSSNRGIFRVLKSDLEAFHLGEINEIRSVGYTEKDGLLSREANGGIQPAGIKTGKGRLWFPTQNGAVTVDPKNIQSNKTLPPVIIESVSANDATVWTRPDSTLVLPTGRRNFDITYTALSLLVPEKNQFRYKLEDFDEGWRSAGNRRTAFYTNVPPGEYTFRVLASNNNGVWNETGASLSIVVPPYFYETTWFYLLCITGMIGLIIAGIRLRTRQLAEAEKQLTSLVKERTNELQREKQKTEQQAEELKKLDTIKSRFFANISHEFRTPLTLIINPLKQMISGSLGDLPDSVSRRHKLMLRNSYRLLRLIDQLLDLSKLEEGRVQVNLEETELVSFTTQICELFELTAAEKNITLALHDDCRECRVWIDADKMEKVIANLISNSIKYTEPGGKVDIRFGTTESTCKIEIKDTGIGISKEQQAYIFDRFYQVENSDARGAEGAGIGLAVVKEFVELHEGEILLDSEKGKGTCFTILLKKGKWHFPGAKRKPIGTETSNGNRKETVEKKKVLQVSSLAGIRENTFSPGKQEISENSSDVTSVLVVEDNTDLRTYLVEILSEDYRVFEAGNGESGLKIIREELPDLIVADIMMPGMDGMTLNSKLKKDPSLASIPLIFLTAKAASEEKVRGFAEGADDYLTKPFDAEVLLARIANLIESRMRLRKQILQESNGFDLNSDQETEDAFLRKLNRLLEKQFGNPELSVANLADQLHMDRTQLYRKLKTKTDLTPQQYVLQFRITKAAQLFKEQRGSVSEVAYASGFNSLSYFASQFREQVGMNPSEYLAGLSV